MTVLDQENLHQAEIETVDAALADAGVSDKTLTQEQKDSLDQNGYCLIQLSDQRLAEIGIDIDVLAARVDALLEEEGPYAGSEGKEDILNSRNHLEPGANRLGNLLDKSAMLRRAATIPEVLAASHYIIGGDLKVSSLNLREPMPGVAQRFHVDWMPREHSDQGYAGALTFLYLDESTLANGPFRIIPGTHTKRCWPDDEIDVFENHPDQRLVEVHRGSILVMNLHAWHSGTINKSGERRRILAINYRRRDLPQLLNQKRYFGPQTKASLSEAEKYLFAVTDCDPTQEALAAGVAAVYTQKFGKPLSK
jgi:ectoine hydroxylase-related dioxygenase (phytanoyl-CoA dioxygenase family)